jgi:hypothetical protein
VHRLITRDGDPLPSIPIIIHTHYHPYPLSSIPIIISSAIFIPIFILIFILILIYMSMLKVDIPIWLPREKHLRLPFPLPGMCTYDPM